MWKKVWLIGLLVLISFISYHEVIAEKEPPAYAKWGRLAMEETKERYPNAQIIDYLHIDREQAGERTTEKFKLWLREETREFGVYIFIEFDSATEKNIIWTFTETDR